MCLCAWTISVLGQGKDPVIREHLNKFIVLRDALTEGLHEAIEFVQVLNTSYRNTVTLVLFCHHQTEMWSFVIIILNSTALENKSFWKTVHITKHPKPTQQIYMLQYWFHSELIKWRSHILILWLHDLKNKDYIQGTKVSTSDLLMNIWLLPCTLSEHSSLARSLIICGIKTSFSTCLSLEFPARVKKR